MPYGKYNLRDPKRQLRMDAAYKKYMRLCGPVVIVQAADPEKLEKAKELQRQRRKKKPIQTMQIQTGKGHTWRENQ